ncbi:hypothetical protein ACJX0J_039067 [Zea mays]
MEVIELDKNHAETMARIVESGSYHFSNFLECILFLFLLDMPTCLGLKRFDGHVASKILILVLGKLYETLFWHDVAVKVFSKQEYSEEQQLMPISNNIYGYSNLH